MIGKYLPIIAASVLVCGCSAITNIKKEQQLPLTPKQMGYDGFGETMLYHTLGFSAMATSNNITLAKSMFENAVKADSTFAPSHFELASIYAKEGKIDKALEYSKKADSFAPNNIWVKAQLGQLYISKEEYGKALNLYDTLTKLDPTNPSNHRILAALYQQQGQIFTAISVLDSAEYRLGRQEELSEIKRQMLLAVNLYDRAIKETQALVNDFPDNYENYIALAQLYSHSKNDSLAIENYLKANELSPNNIEVILSLNEYYKDKGDIANFLTTTKQLFEHPDVVVSDKIKFFKELVNNRDFHVKNLLQINELAAILRIMHPNNIDIIELYTNNQIAQGKLEDALQLYKSYVKPDSTHISIYRTIMDIETYLNHPDSVCKYADMAIAQYPKNSNLYIQKGGSLTYMKRNEEAMAAYKAGYKYADSDSVKSVVIGIIGDITYQKEKNHNKVYKLYSQALKLFADNAMVLNNYAYFLSEDNRELEKARDMAERVMTLAPGNPTYLDTYAWILHKLGDNQKAKKIMQQAISLDSSNGKELFMHYGDILSALGEDFMATIYWRKALEAGYDPAEIEKRLGEKK